MLSGVSILCFAASYGVTFALEVSRLLFRSGIRGALMLGFTTAGLVAHTAFLYYQAVNATGAPLSSEKDWYLLAAWGLAVSYLYLVIYHPQVPFGVLLLPLVLALIGAATFFAGTEPLAREPASRIWGIAHSVSIVLAVVALLVGLAAGLMYLVQAGRLKRKRPALGGFHLPSLEWLQRVNSRATTLSVLMLGAGVGSGIVLNLINARSQGNRLPLADPVVLSTLLVFLWLGAATIVGAWYRPARQGRRVAYFTLVSFVFLVIALSVGLFADSRHWRTEEKRPRTGRCGRVLRAPGMIARGNRSCENFLRPWPRCRPGGSS